MLHPSCKVHIIVADEHGTDHGIPGRLVMVKALDRFFGDRMLSDVTGDTRRAYASQRTTDVAARRELEDLRAAIVVYLECGLDRAGRGTGIGLWSSGIRIAAQVDSKGTANFEA